MQIQYQQQRLNLSQVFVNWYTEFRDKRKKVLGWVDNNNNDNYIYADDIIHEFSSLLEFTISSMNKKIKKDIICSFLYEIFRETSYCYEKCLVNENQCMKKYKLTGILSNCFFTNCIYCNKLLINVDYNCIDKICKNCNFHYEIKSLSWSNYPPYHHFYKFGEISGVKKFLENENNVIVLHTKVGYYYTTVKNLIEDKDTLFSIENTKSRNICLSDFLKYENENNEKKNNKNKVNIQISRKLFKKIKKVRFNTDDVKFCLTEIFSKIDKYYTLPWNTSNNFKNLDSVHDTIINFRF